MFPEDWIPISKDCAKRVYRSKRTADLDEHPVTRKLTSVLYADVAGYSRLSGKDEVGTHREVMRLLDDASRTVQASINRSNAITSGHRACQGCGEALGARYVLDAAMRATEGQVAAVNATIANNGVAANSTRSNHNATPIVNNCPQTATHRSRTSQIALTHNR